MDVYSSVVEERPEQNDDTQPPTLPPTPTLRRSPAGVFPTFAVASLTNCGDSFIPIDAKSTTSQSTIMFSTRVWKKTRREEAATPTPSVNNIEAVSFDEGDDVQLGYTYKGTEEQIQEEQEKNTLYEGMISTCEFRWHRPASWKACQLGFPIVGPGQS